MTFDKINPLKQIWKKIPKTVTVQSGLSQKEIIRKHMDTFRVGPCFYAIFNTWTTKMEYVSPEVEAVLGCLPEMFDLSLIMNAIHPDDLPYYYHYEQSAVDFFSDLSEELLLNYKFSYDYRIKTGEKMYRRVLQQIIPIYYFPEGGARTLGIFTDITHLNVQGTPKLSFIGMEGEPSYYNVHLNKDFRLCPKLFTKREKEILQYIVKGWNSGQIAEALCRSIHTIRAHRKNILQKSGCGTVNELLVKSVREGWV